MQPVPTPILVAPGAMPAPCAGPVIRRSDAARCSGCAIKALCLPGALEDGDLALVDGLAFGQRRLREGEPLYHEGEEARSIYAVRIGTLKSSLLLRDGRQQVTGFQFAGDMVGLDGLASGRHASSVQALEDSQVCTIEFGALCDLARRNARVQQMVTCLLGREIVREQEHVALLGDPDAGRRLEGFLLGVSRGMAARGYSASEFHLRMSRAEIGSYLGLTVETVSRGFSALQRRGVLSVDRKHIHLLDVGSLERDFRAVQ